MKTLPIIGVDEKYYHEMIMFHNTAFIFLINKFMETFEITLIKSYIIRIKAKDSETAKRLCEFYTNDIKDISTKNDRKIYDFRIEEIECKMNEAVDRN